MTPAAAIAQVAVLTPPIEPDGQNAPVEEGSGDSSFLNTLTLAFGATAGEGLPPEELVAEEILPEEFLAEQVALEEVNDLLTLKAHEKGLEYLSSIDSQVPTQIIGDPGRVRQIL